MCVCVTVIIRESVLVCMVHEMCAWMLFCLVCMDSCAWCMDYSCASWCCAFLFSVHGIRVHIMSDGVAFQNLEYL